MAECKDCIHFEVCAYASHELPVCDSFSTDVEPVRHGRWKHNSDFPDRFICYGCGAMFDMWKHEQRLFNYCPWCGAKMDGGDNDAKSM